MRILDRKKPQAPRVGSRFKTVDSRAMVWTVQRLFQPSGMPEHVRLVHSKSGRQMTVAASVLADSDRFTPLDRS